MTEASVPRAAEATRLALIEAATSVFAAHGFRGGSVRMITQAAGANQAAITYHFSGKDGLYRAVLREAVSAFEEYSLLNGEDVAVLDRAAVLRLIMRQFLLPLTQPGRLGRYLQIFGWEGVHPSPVYVAFFAEATPRLFRTVEQLVRRFMPPDAREDEIAIATHWLVQQPIAFVRNAERLKRPPYSLSFDQEGIERLADVLTGLSLSGLADAATALRPQPIGKGR